MILIDPILGFPETPYTFHISEFDEQRAFDLFDETINKANEVQQIILNEFHKEWTKHPSLSIKAVYGQWFFNAYRHFSASMLLCSERDLSTVAAVHSRQILEDFFQILYYASLTEDEKLRMAEKISAIGCIDYLEKLSILNENEYIQKGCSEIHNQLESFDKLLIDEIKLERKKGIYNWFGMSFTKLAKVVSRNDEHLGELYQLTSADIHGSWNLTLDVANPKPGTLDFKGYPDLKTMRIRAAETVSQLTGIFMRLWNSISDSVGAQGVIYSS